jgi:NAD kinase
MAGFDKIVFITRKTALEELIERMNTRAQAKFYVAHRGGSIESDEAAHDRYMSAMEQLRTSIPKGVRSQWIDRSFLPTYTFGPNDLVATLGPDGLVINTAKYLDRQPLVAFNPDPARIDGVLLPFTVDSAASILALAVANRLFVSEVTMAVAELDDGQRLHAVNDLFIGHRSHVSARYRIRHAGREEDQSSSGIIVSTGAGSTGWRRSLFAGAGALVADHTSNSTIKSAIGAACDDYAFPKERKELRFVVREPFQSKITGATIVQGRIGERESLEIASQMPSGGVIFSDGIEADYLEFGTGAVARVSVAARTLRLLDLRAANRSTGR